MNTANQKIPEHDTELRLRTMRTIWLALLASIGMYFMLTLVLRRSEIEAAPNNTLSLALMVLAISATLVSLLIKSKLVNRAIDQHQPSLVQEAYIVVWAINEVAALLGLFDFFRGGRYYYLLFVIAAIGHLLKFPKRQHVEHAAMKRFL